MWPAADIPGQGFYTLGIALSALLALAALLRAWFYDRAKGQPRCHRCAYPAPRPGSFSNQETKTQQTNDPTNNLPPCPECGWTPKRPQDLYRTRRSRKWFAVFLLLLVTGCCCWYATHVQFRRIYLNEPTPIALTPTTWWIAVLPHRTGDEDLTVYHRAYPWGKMRGANAVTGTLLGSGRAYAAMTTRFSGGEQLWGWQMNWAAHQFKDALSDPNELTSDRIDAVFFYAKLSRMDERENFEAMLPLLELKHLGLTESILLEFEDPSTARDLVAPAMADIVTDASVPLVLRRHTAKLLGRCGEACLPYLLPLIGKNDEYLRQCVSTAIAEVYWRSYEQGDELEPIALAVWDAYRSSAHEEDLLAGMLWLKAAELRYGFDHQALSDYLNRIVPQLLELSKHRNHAVCLAANRAVKHLIDQAVNILGPRYHLDLSAWVDLLEQPGLVERMVATDGLSFMAGTASANHEMAIACRIKLRAIVESALLQEQPSEIERRLRGILVKLDTVDAAPTDTPAESNAQH